MRRLLNTLYVTTPQAYLRVENGNVVVSVEGEVRSRVPLHLLEGMVLFGCLGVSPALMGDCFKRGISVSFLGMTGEFLARVDGDPRGNVLLRRTQYRRADGCEDSLIIARRFVAAKIRSQRSVLARFCRDSPDRAERVEVSLEAMGELQGAVPATPTRSELMGVEGKAADHYFSVFGTLIKDESGFVFRGRSRRPPLDETNAMLSFFYSLLAHDVASACDTVGLDPYVGFLHVDRPGRLSLALDIMEEFRPYMVDRFVMSVINRKQVRPSEFKLEEGGAVTMKDNVRKNLISLWQKRKQEEITHPFLKEKVKVGLLPYVQAQLLARYLRGDLKDYPAFIWR